MPRPIGDYLAGAYQFERLARAEDRPEVKQLLQEQAQTCYKLAARRTPSVPEQARAHPPQPGRT
jgi:hypothetical protein